MPIDPKPLTVKDLLLLIPISDPEAGLKRVPQHVLIHPMRDYESGTMYLYFRDWILWKYLDYQNNGYGYDPQERWGKDRDAALEVMGL